MWAIGAALRQCLKPDCSRLVPASVAYCCNPCAVAAEHGHEIDGHSTGCDERAAAREAAGG